MVSKLQSVGNFKSANVAFSGSGFLIAAHCGVACAFMDYGITIEEVSGTSGGSIIAAAIAVGMNSSQIKELALTADFKPLLTMDFMTLISLEAYCNGNALLNYLTEILGDGTISQTKIPCIIMSSNVAMGAEFKFSATTTPNTLLSHACRASASVPFIYTPVQLDDNTLLMDGGMVCNVPINQLSNNRWKVASVLNPNGPNDVSSPLKRASACLSTMLASNEDNLLAWGKSRGADILILNPGNYGFLDTDLTTSDRLVLFNTGYTAAEQLFKKYKIQKQ